MRALLISLLLIPSLARASVPNEAEHEVNTDVPAPYVGWGNTFVPGLGATLRGKPGRGLLEASLEVGTYYGGVQGVKEGDFSIDGSVNLPRKGSIYPATTGNLLQQVGLKLHMFNTFYHYQQTALDQADSERERHNGQPLYRGTWQDTVTAPFRWKNLSSPWTWPVLLGATAYLIADYGSSRIDPIQLRTSETGEVYYGLTQAVVIPAGSAFGEDVFFRGFVQREIRGYTNSAAISIAAQSSLFALIHSNRLNAFLVGTYYGIMANALEGELGPAIASHFWIEVVAGIVNIWSLQRAQGHWAPMNPPLSAQIKIPF